MPRAAAAAGAAASDSDADDDAGADGSFRINKCFRRFASRREADRMVADGRVAVNGRRAGPGDRVRPGDRVELDGRPVAWEELNVLPR